MSVKRSECQRRWRCSRLRSLKYQLTHRLYNTRDVEEGLYQVAYWNGWDADAEAEFSPSLPLFASCKGAQKKQELRVAFSTSSFPEFSKRSFCFAAVIMLRLQDLHTNSEHSLAGKSSPATVLSWLYNLVGPPLLCSDCCNRYRSWA